MQNAFTRFGERAIGSLEQYFRDSRIILTSAYVLVLGIILFSAGGITRFVFTQRINARFDAIEHASNEFERPRPPSASELRQDLLDTVLMVNGFLLLLAGIFSYWLAGLTLRPIEKSYKQQKRFLSDASHELRTPLAILQTNLENERDSSNNEGVKKKAESHLEEIARMNNLVNDLLMLSRLQQSHSSESQELVNLPETVNMTVERMRPLIQKQHLALTYSPLKDTGLIIAAPNKELIVHALSNVIQNAINYNKEHGSITIELTQDKKYAEITVTDTGIGLAPHELTQVFERFYRSDKSRSRLLGGSGLGLSIVQSIMDTLHGSVSIQSEPQIGTKVTLSIPIHRPS